MKQKTPAEQAIKPGRGGVVPPPEHRWRPGRSGNPSGRPKGYVDVATALVRVSALPYSDVQLLSEGKRPKVWHEKEPTAVWVRAARELLSTTGNAAEINGRMDGWLNQADVKKGEEAETRAILAILATLPPLPAQSKRPDEED